MMTLTARLCALCAVCALVQLAMGDHRMADGLRMVGGLLMLHLVIDGCQGLVQALAGQQDLHGILQTLMK
ncbi:MAG: hypothetical protein IJB85_09485 [Clostridia bacterium]|nr:hypothetical protein [Clostridia bacterium]